MRAAGDMSGRLRDPAWRGRLNWTLFSLVLAWPLLVATQFKPWQLFDATSLEATLKFLATFLPPALQADFLLEILKSAWITIAIATAGLSLALLLAIPLTLIATTRLSISRIGRARMNAAPFVIRQWARWMLVILRSVPELVFALLFVRIVGLGPTAGVLAIALAYAGLAAKVFAEIIESSEGQAAEALLKNGASRLQALLYGVLPGCATELVSYTVYRWECAIRGSVIMGMVGAGGLGQQLDTSMKMLNGAEVATILAVFVALVALADVLSAWLRRKMA
jgi:phosphonate transport system permease protein